MRIAIRIYCRPISRKTKGMLTGLSAVCVSACMCESAKDVFGKSLATRRKTDTMCEHTGKRMRMEGTGGKTLREDGWYCELNNERRDSGFNLMLLVSCLFLAPVLLHT